MLQVQKQQHACLRYLITFIYYLHGGHTGFFKILQHTSHGG